MSTPNSHISYIPSTFPQSNSKPVPHPNAIFIIAFANGEQLEYRKIGIPQANWCSYSARVTADYWGPWCIESIPHYEWRIAPKKVMIRHGKNAAGTLVLIKNFSKYEDDFCKSWEKDSGITWLDDWHEASFGPQDSSK